jgi:glutamyl-tRNA synthetase
MSVRVRFAPSPTGYLHIGGARTALYNYLLAKKHGGKFIIRVEDTDDERSKREYEELQLEDLAWLGIEHDIGPGKEDEFGPYRQSERLHIYQEYTDKLVDKGLAFYDFSTEEEIEAMRELNEKDGTSAYTGKWREEEHFAEAKKRVAAGEKTSVRFKVDPTKSYELDDLVRKNVKFPPAMVGDFVIMRSNGKPTYNFCNVIDDHLHQISHVLRGEEHLNNTVRQLMIYEAYGWTAPKFAHLSIMIGEDRQKLSKRHGATSVHLYKQESYLPEAMNNYLSLLGWSHPEEISVFTKNDLVSVFDEHRFNKSPAMYDIEKLKWTNSQHLKLMSEDDFLTYAIKSINKDHYFHTQTEQWKKECVNLLREKVDLISEIPDLIDSTILNESFQKSDALDDILSWDTTPKILDYVKSELESIKDDHVSAETFSAWMDYCKKELSIKGKPLFMGFRGVLTGQDHGPDLKVLIPLTPIEIIRKRVSSL